MKTSFQDLDNEISPRNGATIADRPAVIQLLDDFKDRAPFMCQFVGDNGYGLTVGLSHDHGCIQYAANDRAPPYLMAVLQHDVSSMSNEMVFSVGGTPTPIDGRYRLTLETLKEVVAEFVVSGSRSDRVEWEEF